jgi:hypothetical protein
MLYLTGGDANYGVGSWAEGRRPRGGNKVMRCGCVDWRRYFGAPNQGTQEENQCVIQLILDILDIYNILGIFKGGK